MMTDMQLSLGQMANKEINPILISQGNKNPRTAPAPQGTKDQ